MDRIIKYYADRLIRVTYGDRMVQSGIMDSMVRNLIYENWHMRVN